MQVGQDPELDTNAGSRKGLAGLSGLLAARGLHRGRQRLKNQLVTATWAVRSLHCAQPTVDGTHRVGALNGNVPAVDIAGLVALTY